MKQFSNTIFNLGYFLILTMTAIASHVRTPTPVTPVTAIVPQVTLSPQNPLRHSREP